jgi:ADP-ribose pyrophosphatase YjhB (NUDIX family)
MPTYGCNGSETAMLVDRPPSASAEAVSTVPSRFSRGVRPRIAVNAIIFDGRERVLLARRRDIPIWGLPGGLVETGETVTEAVEREVLEEVRVTVRTVRLVGVYSHANVVPVRPAKGPTVVLAFRCRIVSGRPQSSDEVAEVGFFAQSDLPSMIETHPARIRDAAVHKARAIVD